MSVRMADVLRFIQNTHNVTDLETIRDEVEFYLTLAARDFPTYMRGQDAHEANQREMYEMYDMSDFPHLSRPGSGRCSILSHKRCDSRLANGMPAGGVGIDKTGRYCTDDSHKVTFAMMWCDNEGAV